MTPGDRQQFERFTMLWTGTQARVHGYLLTFTQNEEAARDLCQDVAIVLWRKFDKYEEGSNFFAWSCKIARFEAMNWRRRHHRRCVELSDEVLNQLADEALAIGEAYSDRVVALRKCLSTLPERQRELLTERYGQRRATAEMAVDRGTSVSAVYKSLNRIHKALGRCINTRLGAAPA